MDYSYFILFFQHQDCSQTTSPAVPHTISFINKLTLLEQQTANLINNSDSRIFISVGENEDSTDYLKPVSELLKILEDNGFPTTIINFRMFKDGVHFSTPAENLTYGLIFSFEKKGTSIKK